MNARTLAALALSAAVGAFAPVHAQQATAASSGTAMSHEAMHASRAMKDTMHKDGMDMKMKMKKDAMDHGAMKPKAMKHDGMMKKGDAMKMKKDAGGAMDNGG
ncbi:MAG: pentapeptide MXKDX repeat protein [Xanthomonadaceae bacterium]|nr:pentapeptide MXKDX repeat protein [Xanthomonadaceae bacterium]MDE2248896.1 pentapeptide MXKDX repeat protein [Xanthomonadaceae bacterium]